jgi:hypothetical protein
MRNVLLSISKLLHYDVPGSTFSILLIQQVSLILFLNVMIYKIIYSKKYHTTPKTRLLPVQ